MGSGKAASGRQSLESMWALSAPRCPEQLSWQRRARVPRYRGRSGQHVSRQHSLMGEGISRILWSQTQEASPTFPHLPPPPHLGSHCSFLS